MEGSGWLPRTPRVSPSSLALSSIRLCDRDMQTAIGDSESRGPLRVTGRRRRGGMPVHRDTPPGPGPQACCFTPRLSGSLRVTGEAYAALIIRALSARAASAGPPPALGRRRRLARVPVYPGRPSLPYRLPVQACAWQLPTGTTVLIFAELACQYRDLSLSPAAA
jgi:hypothetical protein